MNYPLTSPSCVADASYDLDNQEIFTLSLKHADANRLVGVFTKCDMPGTDVEVETCANMLAINLLMYFTENRDDGQW